MIFLEQEAFQSNHPEAEKQINTDIFWNKNNNHIPYSLNLFRSSGTVNFDKGFFNSNNINDIIGFKDSSHNDNNINNNELLKIKMKLVMEKINIKITGLFSVIQKHLDILKIKFFLALKDYYKKRKINLLKAEFIFIKFQNLMLNISKIYSKFQKLKFCRLFFKWKNYSFFVKKLNQLKTDIEKNSEKKYEKELKTLETKVKEKEEENTQVKKTLQKNSEIESGILKTISEFDNKENNFLKSIKKLEDEKKAVKEEIDLMILESSKIQSILKKVNSAFIGVKGEKNSLIVINNIVNLNNDIISNSNLVNNNISEYIQKISSDNSENNNENVFRDSNSFVLKNSCLLKLQEKIKDNESRIVQLRENNREKDRKINVFMSEMAELIKAHENNSKINNYVKQI